MRGAVRVPTSKSIAQRLVVAAGLAGGETRLARLPAGEDAQRLLGALREARASVAVDGDRATIRGRPPGPGTGWTAGGAGLDVGESGTGARLVTAALGLCGLPGVAVRVAGRGSLSRRASPALFEALRRAGVVLDEEGRAGGWPVRVTPIGPPSTLRLDRPSSSQEVSALLLALAAWPDVQHVEVSGGIPSRPYVDLTRRVLERFDVRVDVHGDAFAIPGPLVAPAGELAVEPDASAAAVALAAGALSGGDAEVAGLTLASAQGDVRVVEHLRAFGIEAGERAGGLCARGAPTRGATLDLAGEPDLAPVLAAVAGAAALSGAGASRLTGLETLPGKESSRIDVLAAGLAALGVEVDAGPGHLAVLGAAGFAGGAEEVTLDPHGDHRMAFAFALLGLVRPGVLVSDPDVVAKSWPDFWEDLARAGATRAVPAR